MSAAYYQFTIEVLPGEAGATVVRLSAKITAWYADRDVAKSGYEVLASNGTAGTGPAGST